MKVLVIGSGGREHALAWKLAQSPKVDHIYVAPGNGGMQSIAEMVAMDPMDFAALSNFARKHKIDLTVVGPEIPLDAGIVNYFQNKGLKIFGPSQEAAKIESSKIFAKNLMKKYHIPTAAFQICDSYEEAVAFLQSQSDQSWVIKADGLAAGKGVIICNNKTEALDAAQTVMENKKFGDAGGKIVIEEFMEGEEASVFALTDGNKFVILPASQDHKRVFDQDKGPNTGGMGAYAPAPIITSDLMEQIKSTIIEPTIQAMRAEGVPFTGCLYAGLMITNGEAKVVEFNCRFGDPETQVVLPLLKDDLFDIMYEIAEGDLKKTSLSFHNHSAVTVVLASGGYPEKYEKEKEIFGLLNPDVEKNALLFHAGTKYMDGKLVTNGGRVLNVTVVKNSLKAAVQEVYSLIDNISFDKVHYRTDIGQKGLKYISGNF